MEINFKGLWGSSIISRLSIKNSPKVNIVIQHDYHPFADDSDEFISSIVKQNTGIEYNNNNNLGKNIESKREFVVVHEPLGFSEKNYLDFIQNKTDATFSKLIEQEIDEKDLKI